MKMTTKRYSPTSLMARNFLAPRSIGPLTRGIHSLEGAVTYFGMEEGAPIPDGARLLLSVELELAGTSAVAVDSAW